MNRDTLRQLAVWIGVIATIVVNGLANALPINNQMTGDIANQYKGQNLWLPAGYVFAIWGLIYAGFIAFAIYQTLPHKPRIHDCGASGGRLSSPAHQYHLAALLPLQSIRSVHRGDARPASRPDRHLPCCSAATRRYPRGRTLGGSPCSSASTWAGSRSRRCANVAACVRGQRAGPVSRSAPWHG